jgi:TonB family protein
MEKPIFVRQDDVPLRWHEAVALVRGVSDALDNGRLRSVPAAGELALESDGSLHLPRRAATIAADQGQVVTQLRELLGELLSLDAPAQLRALTGKGEGAPVTTLADFRRGLAFFERPTLESDRRALAARLSTVQEEHQLEHEVERLRRKAEDKAPPAATAAPIAKRKSVRKALFAVAIVLGVGAGFGVAMFTAPVAVGRGAAEGSDGQGATEEKGIMKRLKEVAESAFGTPAPPEAKVAHSDKPAPPPRRSRPSGRPSASPSPPQRSAAAATAPRAAALTEMRLLLPTRVPAWKPPEFTLPEDFAFVFAPGDPDVVPPVLVRPHLPTVGSVGLPSDRLGTVEVVVGSDGRVEHVRLVRTSAERRYYDAMILAAIKAWVFRPASRSGDAVRYRLLIPLT